MGLISKTSLSWSWQAERKRNSYVCFLMFFGYLVEKTKNWFPKRGCCLLDWKSRTLPRPSALRLACIPCMWTRYRSKFSIGDGGTRLITRHVPIRSLKQHFFRAIKGRESKEEEEEKEEILHVAQRTQQAAAESNTPPLYGESPPMWWSVGYGKEEEEEEEEEEEGKSCGVDAICFALPCRLSSECGESTSGNSFLLFRAPSDCSGLVFVSAVVVVVVFRKKRIILTNFHHHHHHSSGRRSKRLHIRFFSRGNSSWALPHKWEPERPRGGRWCADPVDQWRHRFLVLLFIIPLTGSLFNYYYYYLFLFFMININFIMNARLRASTRGRLYLYCHLRRRQAPGGGREEVVERAPRQTGGGTALKGTDVIIQVGGRTYLVASKSSIIGKGNEPPREGMMGRETVGRERTRKRRESSKQSGLGDIYIYIYIHQGVPEAQRGARETATDDYFILFLISGLIRPTLPTKLNPSRHCWYFSFLSLSPSSPHIRVVVYDTPTNGPNRLSSLLLRLRLLLLLCRCRTLSSHSLYA
eukprot:gene11753-8081_t